MTMGHQPDAHAAAVRYLISALEEIEKARDQKAAHHARMALKGLQQPPIS